MSSRLRPSVSALLLRPRAHPVTGLLQRHGVIRTTVLLTLLSCALSFVATAAIMAAMFGGMNRVALVLALVVPLICSPVIIVALLHSAEELQRTREQLRRLSITDDLTQAYNRRWFMGLARQELARVGVARGGLSVVLLDLDGFKAINDEHGHLAGDMVLQAVAASCRDAMRERDAFARLGGDEFAALLPDTDAAAAERIAELLGRRVTETAVPWQGGTLRLQASIGVACTDEAGYELEALLHAADAALYAAKRARPEALPPTTETVSA
jgi:diguanylate cyclase (GGDEF)-like protein